MERVDGLWYCMAHLPAAKAVVSKRRDRGFGTCSVPGCDRPAAETGGKCTEHRAGERAAGAPVVIINDGSGRGDHPYAPKPAVIYIAVFPDSGVLKVGKALPWTVRNRVRDATEKTRIRQVDTGAEFSVTAAPVAWEVPLFDGRPLLWAIAERVEHAAAGRLAYNVGADSVDHTEGKEWLRHGAISSVDWGNELHRAVRETMTFFGYIDADAGSPRRVQ